MSITSQSGWPLAPQSAAHLSLYSMQVRANPSFSATIPPLDLLPLSSVGPLFFPPYDDLSVLARQPGLTTVAPSTMLHSSSHQPFAHLSRMDPEGFPMSPGFPSLAALAFQGPLNWRSSRQPIRGFISSPNPELHIIPQYPVEFFSSFSPPIRQRTFHPSIRQRIEDLPLHKTDPETPSLPQIFVPKTPAPTQGTTVPLAPSDEKSGLAESGNTLKNAGP